MLLTNLFLHKKLCTDRPNHDLSYVIGENFCLEDAESFPDGVTVKCPLANIPVPSPEYTITIKRVANDGNEEMFLGRILISNNGRISERRFEEVHLHSQILSSLFDNDTDKFKVNITCQVYNLFGTDNMTTFIRICSELIMILYTHAVLK